MASLRMVEWGDTPEPWLLTYERVLPNFLAVKGQQRLWAQEEVAWRGGLTVSNVRKPASRRSCLETPGHWPVALRRCNTRIAEGPVS